MTDKSKGSTSDDTKNDICDEEKIVHDPEDRVRRQALQKIIAGAGMVAGYHVLPDKWIRPVVDKMVLPAHAATSVPSLNDPCTLTLLSGNQSTATVQIRVDGFVIPPVNNLPVEIAATTNLSATPQVTNSTTGSDGTFSENITVTGGPGITSVSVTSTVTGAVGEANCSVTIPAVTTTTTTTTTAAPTSTPA